MNVEYSVQSKNPKIGNYTILQTLGTGSFGKVKLAYHTLVEHKVAMKMINRKKITNTDMRNRVKREISYLKKLKHPHIIKLYEVITTPTDIIMVIEYAGGELFNYIVEKGKMGENEARRFFQQIISAVEHCHQHQIVHRDLKPENLLLDSFDNIKIADFGLSNIMTDGEFLRTSCGSPNYAAPEVINGKLYAGPEVDIWSCGVILFVMLCGRLPFDDEHIPSLFRKITSGAFVIPPYVTAGARSLLTGMIVVDPMKRMTLSSIKNHPWFQQNLPEYLARSSKDLEPVNVLEDSIISELEEKLSFSRDSIVRSLEEPYHVNNEVKVAYQLLIDHHSLNEHTNQRQLNRSKTYPVSSSPPGWILNAPVQPMTEIDQDEHYIEEDSSISVLSGSVPRSNYHSFTDVKQTPIGPTRKRALSTPFNALPPFSHSITASSPTPIPIKKYSPPLDSFLSSEHDSLSPYSTLIKVTESSPTSGLSSPPLPKPMITVTDASPATSPRPIHKPAPLKIPSRSPSPSFPSSSRSPRFSPAVLRSPISDFAQSHSNYQDRMKYTETVETYVGKFSNIHWHFGIHSYSHPNQVMLELFKVFKKLDMRWKTFSPYHLRVLYDFPDGVQVKFDFQLFRFDQSKYLLDFKFLQTKCLTDLTKSSSFSNESSAFPELNRFDNISIPELSSFHISSPFQEFDNEPAPMDIKHSRQSDDFSNHFRMSFTRADDLTPRLTPSASPEPPTSESDAASNIIPSKEDPSVFSVIPFFNVASKFIAELARKGRS